MRTTSFSHVVSGAESVTSALGSCKWACLWWRVILWLHGKPTAPVLSDDERRRVVARGFRFYAMLYLFLAVLFLGVGAACWIARVFETTNQAIFGVGTSFLAGIYLLLSSTIGFTGAKSLDENRASARAILVVFMVAIISFLSMFVGALSVMFQWQTERFAALNLCVVAAVWAFGIGSYLIEILYLATELRLDPAP